MKSAGSMREDRVRECAYYLWEASGRPLGRDEEFWHKACEVIANRPGTATRKTQRTRPKQAQPTRKRSRSAGSEASATLPPP